MLAAVFNDRALFSIFLLLRNSPEDSRGDGINQVTAITGIDWNCYAALFINVQPPSYTFMSFIAVFSSCQNGGTISIFIVYQRSLTCFKQGFC